MSDRGVQRAKIRLMILVMVIAFFLILIVNAKYILASIFLIFE
jgi:hypothetical protein